jgi:hypothetical protein
MSMANREDERGEYDYESGERHAEQELPKSERHRGDHDEWAQIPTRRDFGWQREREDDRTDVYAREDTISFRGTRTPDHSWPPLQAGPHRGKGPKGYQRSDASILEEACGRLSDDGWLDASDITVTVANSEITLEGSVADRNAKRRAEDLVAAVRGVWDVHNRLRVRRPDEPAAAGHE